MIKKYITFLCLFILFSSFLLGYNIFYMDKNGNEIFTKENNDAKFWDEAIKNALQDKYILCLPPLWRNAVSSLIKSNDTLRVQIEDSYIKKEECGDYVIPWDEKLGMQVTFLTENKFKKRPCLCAEHTVIHELIHATTAFYKKRPVHDNYDDQIDACATFVLKKRVAPASCNLPSQRCSECKDQDNNKSRCCQDSGGTIFPPDAAARAYPDNDHSDDNYSSASPRAVEGVYESLNPEVLVLKHGFWEEAGAYMNKLGKRFSYIEPDQSPFEMKDPPSILYIPSGGLYGLENSPQFKNILHDFVFRGGTVIVSSQQHGYEFKSLPGGENIEAHGWREDISCFIDSTFIDWWHPVFSRITEATISIPVDGYFTKIPDGSTILLSRTGKADAELFYYSFGQGTVVASASFKDYVNWTSGAPEKRRAVFRDLLTWALAPQIPVPQYNLRNNPSPAVNLNVEVENRSEETASSAKIIWLTPDRRVVYEEEKLVSLPPGGMIEIPLSYSLSNIPESNYGIWHVDYVLYGLDDQEVQSQREADENNQLHETSLYLDSYLTRHSCCF